MLLRNGLIALLACGLFVTDTGYAADVFVSTSPSGGTYNANFNPRADNGLLTVASRANDVTAADIVPSA